ncbi:MAG: oligopeptide transport system substrate-binding protein [Sphingobacteriales bacterium]|jgi:oligopeptide transport system substrate-binding protein
MYFCNMLNTLIISLFSLLLLISGCSGNNSDRQKKILNINFYSPLTSLDPAYASNQNNIWIVNQLFDGLVRFDSSLTITPSIAKTWESSDDLTTYTFVLRNDVFFHKHVVFGEQKTRKVTAYDFEYSLNRIRDPKTASPGAWIFNDKTNDSSFKALNDTVFKITLTKPFPPFLSLLAMQYCSVVPHELIKKYGKDFRENPIGTGPFVFNLWKENERLILWKNNNYFIPHLALLDAVTVQFIYDKQSEFLEFLKGKIHLINNIDGTYKDDLITKNGKLKPKYASQANLITKAQLNTEYLGILVDKDSPISQNSILKDLRIRKAINYGINKKKMMLYLRNNIGTPSEKGIIPIGLRSHASSKIGYTYDFKRAQDLIADVKSDGLNLSEEIILLTTPTYKDLTEFIAKELNSLGLNVKIEVSPGSALRQKVAKSQALFFRASWIADYPDGENYLSLFYSKNFAPIGPNYTHYQNNEFDDLYERSLKTKSLEKRNSMYQKMDSLLMSEAPIVPLYYDQIVLLVKPEILNLKANPLNLLDLRGVDIDMNN